MSDHHENKLTDLLHINHTSFGFDHDLTWIASIHLRRIIANGTKGGCRQCTNHLFVLTTHDASYNQAILTDEDRIFYFIKLSEPLQGYFHARNSSILIAS